MEKHVRVSTVIAVMLIFTWLGIGYAAADSSVVATERWQWTIDYGNGTGVWTFSKQADGRVVVDGQVVMSAAWTYIGTVTCLFAGERVTISGPVFPFIATGTATHSSAPVGYQVAPFTLEVKGEATGGKASGLYTISFLNPEWPPNLSGKWTATRIEGGGISE
jgi:hypothetical protein